MNIRKSVYDLQDDTLSWYSKAVAEMKTRDISDPTSWWYQAAMHGYPSRTDYPSQADYQYALDFWASAPGYPPSSDLTSSPFWNRCQHGTWFFLPWHRMYLYYFEQIVADTVVSLGGPAGWTLPFWNYCEYDNPNATAAQQQQALNIPDAFGSASGANANTPDLWMPDRANYTMRTDYVSSADAMAELVFTNDNNSQNGLEFGGGRTGFSHFGNQTGQLELMPHNAIHRDVGGAMADPNTAALDPIFWLHHSSIDRLWQVWLDKGDNRANPVVSAWLDFPFKFHDKDNNVQVLTPGQVGTTTQLNYVFQSSYPATQQAPLLRASRTAAVTQPELMPMDVLGASNSGVSLSDTAADVPLEIVPAAHRVASLPGVSSPQSKEKTSILKINNVKGSNKAPSVNVFLNSGKNPSKSASNKVATLSFFGLGNASTPSLEHDGSGMNFTINISKVVNKLRQQNDWDEDNLSVTIEPEVGASKENILEIGRISLHTECD